MNNFLCPVCGDHASVLEKATIGGYDVIRFKCDCGESGVDEIPIEAEPAVIPDTPAAAKRTPWQWSAATAKERSVPKRRRRSSDAKIKAAWDAYLIARQAYRAGVVTRAESDLARDAWMALRQHDTQIKEIKVALGQPEG